MLSFLATLGTAAIGLAVLLFCLGIALSFWRELAAIVAVVILMGAIGVAGVFYLFERADRKAAEQLAQNRYEADVQTVRRLDARDKLRTKLQQEWLDRSEQCRAGPSTDLACNPVRFAVARMKAFHAAELAAPKESPPNVDSVAQYGVVWDTSLGEFKFRDQILFLEDLARAVEKEGAIRSQDLRGKAKDDEYRRRDQAAADARERVRERTAELASRNEPGLLGALLGLLIWASLLWGTVYSVRERCRQYGRYRTKRAADKAAHAARAVAIAGAHR